MSCCKCTHRWDTLSFWPLGDGCCESPLLMATSPQLDESWPAVIVCFYNSGPHYHIRWMRQSSFSGGFGMTASRKHAYINTLHNFVCVRVTFKWRHLFQWHICWLVRHNQWFTGLDLFQIASLMDRPFTLTLKLNQNHWWWESHFNQ